MGSTLEEAISLMNGSSTSYDVVIVCTSDNFQADYWKRRLSLGLCSPKGPSNNSPFPMVLAVSEDWWAGGAGNGLGTLYAFQKASALAQSKYGVDLLVQLDEKAISAALYHTAGKGTRLAPLPASENNNKPAVRLPATIDVGGDKVPITVLEAVIKQTSVYAPSRKGRLGVFWGDQIFIPSASTLYIPNFHVDIMCTLGDMVGSEEWKEKGLEKYGVIAVSNSGEAAQVEKVDHATAVEMLKSLGHVSKVGPSLGSFSMSAEMLRALSHEFQSELKQKVGKFDTDPHFWMPMTLSKNDYEKLMVGKGVLLNTATSHYERISAFKKSFSDANKGMGLFGAVDVGSDACWWDYGQLKLYARNNLKMLEESKDASLLRAFMGVTSRVMDSSCGEAKVDSASCVFSSHVLEGSITGSILSKVDCNSITSEGSILVNVSASKICVGKGSIVYNIIDDSEEGIIVNDGEVLVGVFDKEGNSMKVKSGISVDGSKAWKEIVMGNTSSFEDIHVANKNANVTVIEDIRTANHIATAKKFSA